MWRDVWPRGGESAGFSRSSLLPAATEGLIALNKREPLIELRLNEIQLRRKIICFGGQHLQIARTALLIEHQGEVVRSLSCLSEQLLLTAKVTKFLITNEGIRNLLYRILNGFLVGEHRLLPLRSGEPESRTEPSALEQGLTHAECRVPTLRRRADELIQCVALERSDSRQGNAGN